MSFYDSERNELLDSRNPENKYVRYTLNPGTKVLAFKCRSYNKTKPLMMGSVSNGLVTDTRWKCISLNEDETRNFGLKSWTKKDDVDDSHWPQAVGYFSNRDSPWGKVSDISEDAFWISTAAEKHWWLFCRRRLSEMPLKQRMQNGLSLYCSC